MEEHGGNIWGGHVDIDFSVNINPFGMPEKVREAAVQGVMDACQYPDLYKRGLTKDLAIFHNVPKENVVTGNGAAELIYAAVSAVRPGKALIAGPTFSEYEKALEAYGCSVVYCFAREDNEYRMTDRILHMIEAEAPDMVVICNPNNPTGRLISAELLAEINEVCRKEKRILLVDECFMELTDDEAKYSLLQKLPGTEHLMILKAFTKLYAMPGLRLGYLLTGSAGLALRINHKLPPWNVSLPALMAGQAALKETAYVAKCLEYLLGEQRWMAGTLQEAGYHIYPSDTAFLLIKGPPGLQEYCLDRGMLIRDGASFAGIEPGTYRIGIKKHEDNEMLARTLEQAAGELRWQK